MVRPLKNMCEIAIIGGGLAGLAAACHVARLGRLATLFEGRGLYGGQVATVDHLDGLPLPGAHSGQDVAMTLLEEARKAGVQLVEAEVVSVANGAKLSLTDSTGLIYHPHAIIIATGTLARKLNVPDEADYEGRGISHCAACDGGFFRNQDVVVVGGGDAAAHEALVLAKLARKVTMICRSPLRAKRAYIDKLAALENIRFYWDSVVTQICGDASGVSAVRLCNTKSGGESEIPCHGVFPFIGGEPNSAFLPEPFRSPSGYFVASDPRLFAAGAIRAEYGGNAVQALADGVSAAEAAVKYCIKGA